MGRPDSGDVWELTTPLLLAAGTHQVRVAAVTSDGSRSGLVIAPVEIVEPGDDLLVAPPVLLGGQGRDGLAPTLTREFDVGRPIGLQMEVAGEPVRDRAVTIAAALHDARGIVVRETDAVLDPGDGGDRMRATAIIPTSELVAGDYVLVVEARRSADEPPVRHAVPLTLQSAAVAPMAPPGPPRPSTAARAYRPMSVVHGPSTSHAPVGAMVIRTEQAWRAFWSHLPTRQPPPDIDFPRVTLLAFVIEGSTGTPVRPSVERIEPDGDAIVVHWGIAPVQPSDTPNRRPFAVVGVLGHDGPVRFERAD
jgi:hypothetical protein